MKITYLHPNRMPDTEANTINVARMCAALAGAGHEVTLVCRRMPGTGDFHAFYGLQPSYRVIALPLGRIPYRLLYLGALVFHRLRGGDLLYTRNIIAAQMSTLMGMATVLELHQPPSQRAMNKRRFPAVVRRAALKKVLLNSQTSFDDAVSLAGPSAGKCVLAPHGVEVKGEVAPPRDPARPLRACYTGGFYAGRGIELLIEVAAMTPQVEFQLVGADAEQKARVEALLADRDVVNAKVFERVEPGQVAEIIAACDVCLAPYQRQVFHLNESRGANSVTWMSPLKVFDYMGSGRTIVASDLPAIRAIVEDGVSALLCDPDSAESWSQALKRLAADPQLANQLAVGARALALEKYAWPARAAAALD